MVSCESGESDSDNSSYNGTSSGSTTKFAFPTLFVLLAAGSATTATLIAMFNIYKHLRNYNRPEFQKSLIRILFIVPVYAVFSWLSLGFSAKSLIFESIRDVWEAVVIYEFLKLILAYCGGESACLLVIMKNPGSIEHMWPFNYCFPRLRLDARFMRICKRFTLQFVIIKPIMAIINIIMLEMCMYTNSLYNMSQLIVYNISYSFALYGLVLFYLATHHHPGLMSRKPLLKFMAIKTIIFATYYQGLLVQLVPGLDRHYLEALNNFIFCWEMIVFALVHVWAFGWFEYVGGKVDDGLGMEDGGMDSHIAGGAISLAMRPEDIMEMQQQQPKQHGRKDDLNKNAQDAFNMVDVVGDTVENFSTKYTDHVRLDTKANNNGIEIDEEDEHEEHNPFSAISPSKQINHDVEAQRVFPPPRPTSGQGNPPNGNAGATQQQPNPFNQANPFHDDLSPI